LVPAGVWAVAALTPKTRNAIMKAAVRPHMVLRDCILSVTFPLELLALVFFMFGGSGSALRNAYFF
jgi:hypothetical protein